MHMIVAADSCEAGRKANFLVVIISCLVTARAVVLEGELLRRGRDGYVLLLRVTPLLHGC
jgi:hypothetical protein